MSTRYKTIETYKIGNYRTFRIQRQGEVFRVHYQYLPKRRGVAAVGKFICEDMETENGCRYSILLFLSKRGKGR